MQPGALIAQKYRVLRRLGEGAMGSVWAAENELTQGQFAIKLIHRSHVMADELRERLLREARACGRLRHKNVVEIYDVGETTDGDPFLVMELLDGETLEQLLARRGRLPAVQVAAIGFQVASALAAAHAAGIIHRDLKPANVFLHSDADLGTSVKVLDFGVSKLVADRGATTTTTGAAVGSPAYMSPEQATAQAGTDHRTDLWSLGVLLYEAAAGKPAFAGETAYAVVGNILHGPIPELAPLLREEDRGLGAIVARCLRREVEGRMPSARQLAAELEQLLPRSAAIVLRDLEDEPTLSHDGGRAALASADPVSAPGAPVSIVLPAAFAPSKSWLPLAAAGIGLFALAAIAIVAVAIGQRSAPADATLAQPSPELAASPPHASAAEPVIAPATADAVPAPAPSAPAKSAARRARPAGAARAPAPACPDDKVIFGADGKKRCALAGRRVP